MRRAIPVLFCALLATGCGSSATKPASKADIAAAEVSLTSAIRLANTCLTQTTVGPCTVPATRTKIIADIHTAHDAFKQVQAMSAAGTPVSLSLVTAAMSQLVADTPK